MTSLSEIIRDTYVLGAINDISSPSFTPSEGLPDADTFFAELSSQLPDYIGLSECDYTYHDVSVYWWMAFGSIYLAIPEWDLFERHDGKWATAETAMEAAHEMQHSLWHENNDN